MAFTAIGIGVMLASPAVAQDVRQSDLELCAGLETAELKLACFEALTAIGKSREDGLAQVPMQATVPPAAATAPAAGPAPSTATPSSASGTRNAETPALAVPRAVEPRAAVPPRAEAATSDLPDQTASASNSEATATAADSVVAPEAVRSTADELGSEHLARRQDGAQADEVIRATVARVEPGRYDLLYFHFKNGQVWRQIEARRFRYPKNREFDVLISQGMLGDYRLRLDEDSPMTRIRRIQ